MTVPQGKKHRTRGEGHRTAREGFPYSEGKMTVPQGKKHRTRGEMAFTIVTILKRFCESILELNLFR
jgi:hypothetical protein